MPASAFRICSVGLSYVCLVLCTRRTARSWHWRSYWSPSFLADHESRSTGPTVDRFEAQHEERSGRFVLGLEGFRTNTSNTWRERKGDARAGPAVVGTSKRTSTALTGNRAGPSDEPLQAQHQETLDSVGRQVPVIADQYDPEKKSFVLIESLQLKCGAVVQNRIVRSLMHLAVDSSGRYFA